MKIIRNLFALFSVLLQWSQGVRHARAIVVLVTITGIIAGFGSTAIIAIINAVLTGNTSLRTELLWGFIGLCILIPLAGFASQVLLVQLTAKSIYGLRMQLSHQILSSPLRLLEELGASRLLATFTEDIPTVIGAIVSIPLLFTQFAIMMGCLVYLGWLSWPLLLLVIVYMTLGILSHQLPLSKAMRYFRLQREQLDSMYKLLRALTEGTKELKLHRRRRWAFLSQKFEPTAAAILRYGVKANTISYAAANWGQILFFLFIGAILFIAPFLLKVDTRTLTGYTLTVLYMISPLTVILNTMPVLGRAQISADKIKALGLSLTTQPLEAGTSPQLEPEATWEQIELMGVTHVYQQDGGANNFTLGPLHLAVRPAELIFLIGGNGSGKTTLAKLLVGLYEPEAGEIHLNGQPITRDKKEDYQQHFSAIFSDFYLFESLLGLSASALDLKAQDYLSQFQLSNKVQIKDGELSTIDLSQGQRKRLALLTAYLEDRPIYIFDEWAADQDPAFKQVFYHQLLPELKARGKTVVVISHDDRFYHLADRIIKLEHGQIEYDRYVNASYVAPAQISALFAD